MKVFFLLVFAFLTINLQAQTKTSDEWANIYRSENWKATNYINLVSFLMRSLNYKPVGILKGQDSTALKIIILQLDEDDIRQLNITGAYHCSVRHDETHLLWDLKYFKVSNEMWDKYCKAFVALMEMDGTLRK